MSCDGTVWRCLREGIVTGARELTGHPPTWKSQAGASWGPFLAAGQSAVTAYKTSTFASILPNVAT
eukprot:scaffold43864_cov18-Tisochrysis_lutea.AAC.1